MLALEWNLDDAKQAWFEEGMEQGLEQGREQGLKRGMEQGREQEREAVAVKLIRRGRPFDEIHEDTGLSLQHIQKLAQNNSAN